MKQGSLAEHEGAVLGTENFGARQIRGQQIRRELQAVKIALDAVAEDLDGPRLGQPRGAFHQQMAIAQQRDQHPVDQSRLAHHQALQVFFQTLKLGLDGHRLAVPAGSAGL